VSHPFVAPPLPLESPVSDLPGKLVCREHLSLAHFLPCIYIKGTELYSESPLAEKRSGDDHGRHIPSLGAGRQSSGIIRQAAPIGPVSGIKTARGVSPTDVAPQRRWLLAHRRSARHADRINLAPRIGHDVRRGRCSLSERSRLSGAATNHTVKEWQPSLRRCHLRNWTVKRRKERGRKAAYLE
jgi:hypothetical protein